MEDVIAESLLALVAVLAAPSAAERSAATETILSGLNAARRGAGAASLVRDPLLDGVARERAGQMAAQPDGRRFALEDPISDLVEKAGVRRYQRTAEHRATLAGFEDIGAAVLASWRDQRSAWIQATQPGWKRAGVAIGPLENGGGGFAVVVVFLEPARTLPEIADLEREIFDAVNAVRGDRGLERLAWSPALAEVARAHSRNMARLGFFDHFDLDGRTPAKRLDAAGITYTRAEENIAKNLRADDPVADTVQGWMESPPHRQAILDARVIRSGVGVALAEDGTIYFTQLFIHPPDEGTPRP